MKRVMVTGAAGFIGSHVVEALLQRGCAVLGIDCFTDNYSEAAKNSNLTASLNQPSFELVRLDLAMDPLEPLLDGVDTVFHLAAQPGVRSSWASGFSLYVDRNIVATQRVLEALRTRPDIKVVNSSSSSVYGNAVKFPTPEDEPTRPFSPYGVTKLAAEQLCSVYAANWGLPVVSLRYFTVYGPRQRPDMATRRMIEASLAGTSFPLFGDGSQVRDFTYVGDVVQANLNAAAADVVPGAIYNIGGGSSCSMEKMIDLVSATTGRPVHLSLLPTSPGDAAHTSADISRAWEDLKWKPVMSLREGLAAQVAWQGTVS